MKNEKHHIRPAARIIDTLGKGLIKDDLAAVIELVKNSYDADSETVVIKFEHNESENELTITVEDSGHGMSFDTVINKWLVPGTSDKLQREKSPKKKRRLQGRKGIGRYAAGILGHELFLLTVDENANKTELLMDWGNIANHEYLDEVEIQVDTKKSKEHSGTRIEIRNKLDSHEEVTEIQTIWSDKKINQLKVELSKLLSPVQRKSSDKFSIRLEFGEFPSETWKHVSIDIEPLPLLELYDYRIHGTISKTGIVKLSYENQCIKPEKEEAITFPLSTLSDGNEFQKVNCGRVSFDLRVFDRDPKAIDEIVKRANISTSIEMTKTDVKRWLNEYNGVGIYRGGFRVRPYGDKAFDWLNLGSRRVDIPALRIGSNQIIGILDIEPEELSGLEEKSARDGLIENLNFRKFQTQIIKVIEVLERKRYDFRVASGRGRKMVNLDQALESLFDFDNVVNDISKKLKKMNIRQTDISSVTKIILDAKEEKSKELADIKETIAYYQGQANLGKMVGHILHEGRKPVSYLRHSLPEVASNIKKIVKNQNNKKAIDELDDESRYLIDETEKLHNLFSNLDPFAYKKGERSKLNKLKAILVKSKKVFEHAIRDSAINLVIDIDSDIEIYGRQTDFYWIFANLIENSIHWLNVENRAEKLIEISLHTSTQFQTIKFYDNGPGISEEILNDGKLFEPGISMKNGGTGMGLSIAGELARRNSGDIWATNEEEGVSFFLRLPSSKELV